MKRKLLLLLCVLALCLCTVAMAETCTSHSWDYSRYEYDTEYHWRVCEYCGEASTSKSRHTIDCMTGECYYCDATEISTGSSGSTHTAVDWSTYYHDTDYHWLSCGCGATVNKSSHYVDCGTGECTTCGQTGVNGSSRHTYTYGDWQYDDTSCWMICTVCGDRVQEQEHYVYCSTGKCTYCGQSGVGGYLSHSWDYDNYQYDADSHWYVCKYCGEANSYKYSHSISCVTGACTSCGATDVNGSMSHSYSYSDWYHDQNNHWHVCTLCNEAVGTEEHYVDCQTGECYYCEQTNVTGTVSHSWDWSTYLYDDTHHWYKCRYCDETYNVSEHYIECSTGACYYCDATNVTGERYHSFDYSTYKYDTEHHWYACRYCGEANYKTTHYVDCETGACTNCGATGVTGDLRHSYDRENYAFDDEYHWLVCKGCGNVINQNRHWTSCQTGACTTCGQTNVTSAGVSHEYDYDVWYHDDTHHWRICEACGEMDDYYEHYLSCQTGECTSCGASDVIGSVDHYWDYNYYISDATHHWRVCRYCEATGNRSVHYAYCGDGTPTTCSACGQTDIVCRVEHDVDWNAPEYDEYSHWYICEDCGEIAQQSEHYISCATGECFECGAKNVEGYLDHNTSGQPLYDKNYHWYVCKDCGEEVYLSDHFLSCITGACRECGQADVKGYVDHQYDWSNCQYDDDHHWMVCPDCGEIFNYDTHYLDCQTGICNFCDQMDVNGAVSHNVNWFQYEYNKNQHWNFCMTCGEIAEISNHYLSCTTGECRECGQSDVNGYENHAYNWNDWKYDNTKHWHVCTECGEDVNEYEHELSCTTGDCIECGQSGVTGNSGHNWDWSYSGMRFDSISHWRLCLECGTAGQVEMHYLSCTTGECHNCGQKNVAGTVSHRYDEFDWSYNDDECWTYCLDCKEELYRSAHYVSCETGVCSSCGQSGVNGDLYHQYDSTKAQFDKNQHWVSCIHCGKENKHYDHYKYCDSKDDACSYCKQSDVVIGSLSHSYYTYTYYYDQNQHWRICIDCNDVFNCDDHELDKNGVCECGFISTLYITSQPASVAVAEGAKASVTVKVVGTGLSYQWYFRDGNGSFSKSSTTSATYSVEMNAARDGRQVYCIITDKSGNQVVSNTATLKTKSQLKITQQPSSVVVVEGKTASVTVVAEGDGLTYQWYLKDVGASKFSKSSTTSATYSYKMTKEKAGRQVYCVITDAYGNTATTNTVTIGMKTELKITQQPGSGVAVAAGQKASVTVKAQGDGLTYQWYFKDANGSSFAKSSTTSATYSVEMTAARDGRQVYCVVTDKYGDTVTSNTCLLSLYVPLKITSQPADVTVVEGKTGSVTVVAEGTGLTYQWYLKDVGSTSFGKSSTTSATYSYKMTSGKAGRQVYCVITDVAGNTVTTNTVTFTMKKELKITSQPASVAVLSGEKASVTVKATGDGLTYQWYFKDGNGSFAKSSTTSATYSVEMTAARNGRSVYCVVTDKYGETVTSSTAVLTMKTALKITSQPASVTVAEGKTGSVTVKAEGDGLTYTWYLKDVGSANFGKSSITSATYSYKMTSEKAGRQVYCVVTDKYGDSVTSVTATFTMGAALKITSQPASVTVASGEKASVTVKAEGDGLTYEWYFKDKNASSFSKTTSFTGATYAVDMTTARAGRQVYCKITDKYGNTVTSSTATLNMKVTLKITSQPASVTVAAGESASVTVKAEGEGLTYEWYFKDKNASSFSKTTSFTGATYAVDMTTARAGRQVYCKITDKYGNTVTSSTATLNMKVTLKITSQPASVTVAAGESASVTVKAEGEGLTYEWYFKDKNASSFSKTTSFKGATYAVDMTTARAGRQVYCKITDKYGNTVTSSTATLNMKVTLKITSQPASVTVAEGATASVTVKAEGEGLTYQWYFKDGSGSFAKSSTTSATYSVAMTAARAGRQVYCVVTDKSGNTVTSSTATLNMK